MDKIAFELGFQYGLYKKAGPAKKGLNPIRLLKIILNQAKKNKTEIEAVQSILTNVEQKVGKGGVGWKGLLATGTAGLALGGLGTKLLSTKYQSKDTLNKINKLRDELKNFNSFSEDVPIYGGAALGSLFGHSIGGGIGTLLGALGGGGLGYLYNQLK